MKATAGLVDLAEAAHVRIAGVHGFQAPAGDGTKSITGLVYRSIRGVTQLVGGGVDALLGLLAPALQAGPTRAGP